MKIRYERQKKGYSTITIVIIIFIDSQLSVENRICNILMNTTSNKVSLCVCKLFLMIITMDEQQQQQKKNIRLLVHATQ